MPDFVIHINYMLVFYAVVLNLESTWEDLYSDIKIRNFFNCEKLTQKKKRLKSFNKQIYIIYKT